MRSPEARALLDEVLKRARKVADTGSGVSELAAAIREYDYFCFSEHRTMEIPLTNSSTGQHGTLFYGTTKAKHFKLPLGLDEA